MKTLTLTFGLIVTSINLSFSQESKSIEPIKQNTVYAEAFGQGFCWSINYDRLFNTNKRFKNSFSAGLIVVPYSMQFGNGAYYGIPVSYNWLLGKKSHHLELGIGLTGLIEHSQFAGHFGGATHHVYATPKVGYRFQRARGGLFFRATFTPLIDLFNFTSYPTEGGKTGRNFSAFENVVGLDEPIFPWVGLSVGYTF